MLWLLEDCPLQAFLPLHTVVVLSHMGAHLCAGGQVELTGFLLSYAGLGERTAWHATWGPSDRGAQRRHAPERVPAQLWAG